MTPGTYIRKRREAAGVSRDHLATFVPTDPPVPSRTRSEWIESIEAGAYPVPYALMMVLERLVPFDPAVLDALALAEASFDGVTVPPICRVCACSEYDPCLDTQGGHDTEACAWAEPDLCSFCAGREVPAPADAGVLELTPDQQLPPAAGAAA